MLSFLQVNATTHVGIQGISSIRVDNDVLWNPEVAPIVGSRPNIIVYETYGGEHIVPDDGNVGYYQIIIHFLRSTYIWSKYSPNITDAPERYHSIGNNTFKM
jgi:hypothetical protein